MMERRNKKRKDLEEFDKPRSSLELKFGYYVVKYAFFFFYYLYTIMHALI